MFFYKTPSPTGFYYGATYGTHVSAEALDVGGAGWNDDTYDDVLSETSKILVERVRNGDSARTIAEEMYCERDEPALWAIENLVSKWQRTSEIDERLVDDAVEAILQDATIDSECWSYTGGGYRLTYDSNMNDLIVHESPYVAFVGFASPCFNGCHLTVRSHPGDNGWAYCLGPEFYDERNPCRYIPVKIGDWLGMTDEEREAAENFALESMVEA